MVEDKFLYRGLNKQEVNNGYVLMPRNQEPFEEDPRLPIGLPFDLGKRSEHAIRDHQDGIYKSGASTSKTFEGARKYAKEGIVVKIDRYQLKNLILEKNLQATAIM